MGDSLTLRGQATDNCSLGLEKDNSNGTSVAISWCGVTAIGMALQSWCAVRRESAADARRGSPSRIGKEPVKLADGVTPTIAGQKVTVKGKLGELSPAMQGGITAKVNFRANVRNEWY